jgi:MerR family mercuric resistance operon transcriptional regulator|uniref:Transcriptional regulator, MerR family n=1 Tax=Caulobacter sp. (strain K31) TaxID=366602 RepID=B0SUY0_CAUSK
MSPQTIQIGQLSRLTGCNIETIRYYERIGLMLTPPRKGRYRSYGDGDVARLGFVRRARQLGFTLETVRVLLDLSAGPQGACTDVRDLAAAHLNDVRSRITDLKRMEAVLTSSVQACDAGRESGCPLIQTLYAKPVALQA